MKAIVTVIGRDKVGITAAVCALLAQHSINILDQQILQCYWTSQFHDSANHRLVKPDVFSLHNKRQRSSADDQQ